MDSLNKDKLVNKDSCPICDGPSKTIQTVKTININSEDLVELKKCKVCGHWWINPMPAQDYLNSLYEKGSEFVVSSGYQGREEPAKEELEMYVNRFIDKNKELKKMNYLEIGIGPGYLFNFLKEKVNSCYGIDPCSWKPIDSNIVSSIKDIPQNIKFDIIIIQDVLEHLENPLETMKSVREFANKGCLISCGFPNKDALIAKIQKGNWRMIRPVGHLQYFSSKSIDIMFKESGWKIIKKYSHWGAPSIKYIIKNFNWKSKNPFKLIYRIIFHLFIMQLLLGKDQWYVVGKYLN